jgi:hypothetical protein
MAKLLQRAQLAENHVKAGLVLQEIVLVDLLHRVPFLVPHVHAGQDQPKTPLTDQRVENKMHLGHLRLHRRHRESRRDKWPANCGVLFAVLGGDPGG